MVKVLFVCGLFGSWFIFQKWQQEEESQHLVDSVNTVRILPDTIKVNGDSLSFVGRLMADSFRSIINFNQKQKKKTFQNVTDLYDITLKGKLASSQGANNFAGFDYRNYLKTQGIYQTLTISEIIELKKTSSWDIGEKSIQLAEKSSCLGKKEFS